MRCAAKDQFTKVITHLFNRFGQEGQLHSVIASDYIPSTGETIKQEVTANILYTNTNIETVSDINIKEKFVQFDDGLAKFQTSTVSFIFTGDTIDVDETSYIVTASSRKIWFKKLTPYIVNDVELVYVAEVDEEHE
jgi:hypothetical protein